MDFGQALKELKAGRKLRRKGWNGKGIFIKMQKPDEQSFMTHEYIYIDTTGLNSDNGAAPKDRVPWLASQTDMLADDWYTLGDSYFMVSIDSSKFPYGFDILVSGMYGHSKQEILTKVNSAVNHAVQKALNETSSM